MWKNQEEMFMHTLKFQDLGINKEEIICSFQNVYFSKELWLKITVIYAAPNLNPVSGLIHLEQKCPKSEFKNYKSWALGKWKQFLKGEFIC